MLWVWMLSSVGTEVLPWRKSEEVWELTAWSEDPLGHMGETVSPFGVHLKEVALSFGEQKSWWAPLHPPQSIGTETLPGVTNLDACYLLYFTTHSMPLCLGATALWDKPVPVPVWQAFTPDNQYESLTCQVTNVWRFNAWNWTQGSLCCLVGRSSDRVKGGISGTPEIYQGRIFTLLGVLPDSSGRESLFYEWRVGLVLFPSPASN